MTGSFLKGAHKLFLIVEKSSFVHCIILFFLPYMFLDVKQSHTKKQCFISVQYFLKFLIIRVFIAYSLTMCKAVSIQEWCIGKIFNTPLCFCVERKYQSKEGSEKAFLLVAGKTVAVTDDFGRRNGHHLFCYQFVKCREKSVDAIPLIDN